MTTTKQVVEMCENTLGWMPPNGARNKVRAAMASRLKDQLAEHPGTTCDHLVLAVEYLRRKRAPLKSPLGLIYFVDKARESAADPTPARQLVWEQAIAIELGRGVEDEEADRWVTKLVRCHPTFRHQVLEQWHAAGRAT